ncbi:MAG: EAL domain-containing protein [Holophagales bacterium]|nr:EAL domain-containing protein [Holophagales bacterium]
MPGEVEETRARILALCDPELLSTAFQPVFRARTGELEGCEALLRLPPGSGFPGPYEAFTAALRVGLASELEVASTARVLRDAEPFVGEHLIFLNVLAPFLTDPRLGAHWLVEKVVAHGRQPSQVILELPEISRISNFQEFSRALDPYRLAGFRIAIDDFGAGYTNLRMITDISPDFVKLDRVFIEGIFANARKRILVESVVSLCHRINCSVVAEGIETKEDLETCLSAGVDSLQGFLLARPGPAEHAFFVEDVTVTGARGREMAGPTQGPTMPAEAPLSAANACFRADPELDALPVLLSGRCWLLGRRAAPPSFRGVGRPLGAGRRNDAAGTGGRADRAAGAIQTVRPDRRDGTGKGLPGPPPVRRPPRPLLAPPRRERARGAPPHGPSGKRPAGGRGGTPPARRTPFGLARLNVRRFRAFNDRYGFLRGDKLLAHVAAVLRTLSYEEPGSFLAHYGADDFGFLMSPDRIPDVLQRAIQGIRSTVGNFYDPDDLAAGGLVGRDARGGPSVVAPAALVGGRPLDGSGRLAPDSSGARRLRGPPGDPRSQVGPPPAPAGRRRLPRRRRACRSPTAEARAGQLSRAASTNAATFSGGVGGRMPWPRLTMCPPGPAADFAARTAARTSSGVPRRTPGSTFPWRALPQARVRASSSGSFQSTEMTSAGIRA